MADDIVGRPVGNLLCISQWWWDLNGINSKITEKSTKFAVKLLRDYYINRLWRWRSVPSR